MGQRRRRRSASCVTGLRLAYGGGTTNSLNHLEAKHLVSYKKAEPGEAFIQKKQTTLGVFQAKTCPPARANIYHLNTCSRVCVKGPHVTTTCRRIYSSLKEKLLETISSQDIAVTTDRGPAEQYKDICQSQLTLSTANGD